MLATGRGSSVRSTVIFEGTVEQFEQQDVPRLVDREGSEEPLDIETRDYYGPQLSPDGERLTVVVASDSDPGDVWIIDLARGTSSRLTFNPGPDYWARWSPDSQRVVFWSDPPDEEAGLFWQAGDGTGQAERLTTAVEFHIPQSFTPDGTQLVFEDTGVGGGSDLYLPAGREELE